VPHEIGARTVAPAVAIPAARSDFTFGILMLR